MSPFRIFSFLSSYAHHRSLHSFPTRRSSDLLLLLLLASRRVAFPCVLKPLALSASRGVDRKSTRLNSSHLVISYAVFCLKKKQLLSPGELQLKRRFECLTYSVHTYLRYASLA